MNLTKYSEAGGCGCKIPPNQLTELLKPLNLNSSDDAAVIKESGNLLLLNSLDFQTPIVNDPFTYGQISAANSISDIYAMGGRPLSALSILGFPKEFYDAHSIREIISGAINICKEAGISIEGGHSIYNPQPIFGLSVTGEVLKNHIKIKSSAKAGDLIFLTKPLGTGIISTAHKKDQITPEVLQKGINTMSKLNSIGEIIGQCSYVNSMTDVTGFGLIGHLLEVCTSSKLSAILVQSKIPIIGGVEQLINQCDIITEGGKRNLLSFKNKIKGQLENLTILCDPQTNGGLLITVPPKFEQHFIMLLQENNSDYFKIGHLESSSETHSINIK